MAKPANRASVAQAHDGPDYAGALAIIQGRIQNAKTAQSEASGKASKAWQEIEKMGLHRAGAQAAAKVMNISDEDDRVDYLRTFAKLLEVAGLGIPTDLVDAAQGVQTPVVPKVKGPRRPEPKADTSPPVGPAGDTDLAQEPPIAATSPEGDTKGEAELPVERAPRGNVVTIAEAKERVQKHFGVTAPSDTTVHH